MTRGEQDHEAVGFRFVARDDVSAPPEIGQRLPASYQWDGDSPTDERLAGTCAFSAREGVERYARYSHGFGWIVRVGGTDEGRGQEPGEVLVGDAVVLAVEEW